MGTVTAEEINEVDVTTGVVAGSSLPGMQADDTGDSGSASSYWKDHFQLHGYLTTAYLDFSPSKKAPFASSDEIVLGLDEDGTFNYRVAALQLRYDANPKNTFIVQLSHRRLGDSPLKDEDSDVDLDWAFYQFRFTDQSSLKVGRVPVPLGIFNEYRDVGTLLPFFRPSFNFYREGSFVSETIDGVVGHYRFGAGSDWSLDADAYYGEWDLLEAGSSTNAALTTAKVTDGYGLQLWLNTPTDGLRFGLGGQTYDVSKESGFNFDKANWDSWYFSIDGAFEKFVTRAEYKWLQFPVNNSQSPLGEAEIDTWYYQLGWLPLEKLGLYLQQEFTDVHQTSVILARPIDINQREDIGLSVVYSFLPNLVVKGEYHEQKFDLNTSVVPIFGPDGFKVLVGFTEFKSEYSIISLSVSF
jgi:hypothetical protein